MNTVEYYLSKGFDRRAAAYFAGGRRKVESVAPGGDFTLLLWFDNGERRTLDMKPSIRPGTVFAFLNDPASFRRVYLNGDGCVCWDKDPSVNSETVWSNRVDISPDTCYLDSVPMPDAAKP